jgi:hypothetical protein
LVSWIGLTVRARVTQIELAEVRLYRLFNMNNLGLLLLEEP